MTQAVDKTSAFTVLRSSIKKAIGAIAFKYQQLKIVLGWVSNPRIYLEIDETIESGLQKRRFQQNVALNITALTQSTQYAEVTKGGAS